MRRTLCAAFIVLSTTADAQTPQVDRINIVEFGIYTAAFEKKENSEKTVVGYINILTDYKLVTQTETISARQGLRFGVKYVVVGKPNGKMVTLDWITRFPPEGVLNAKGKRFSQNESKREVAIGETSVRTYTFDEAWEMVPGGWVFEFHYQGRKLGEKRFTIVVP